MKVEVLEIPMHAVLSPLGFKKQKKIWRKTLPDMIQLVGLEKMTFGNMYNLCFGLYLSLFSENPRPSLRHAHVDWPLPYVLGKRVPDITIRGPLLDTTNLEKNIPDDERSRRIKLILQEHVLPILDQVDTIDKLRQALLNGRHAATTPYISFKRKTL